MRQTLGRPRSVIMLAVATTALVCSACGAPGRLPGPSWNLTGSKDAALLPLRPVYTHPSAQAAVPQPQTPPTVVYRGGRDPVTGRAPSWGSQQTIERAPLPAPTLAPAGAPLPAGTLKNAAVAPPSGGRPSVEVLPGQSLAGIAQQNRVSIGSLMAVNGLRDPYVIPGQTLLLPQR